MIEYGSEYYKERAKESTPIDKAQLKNVTGGVALTAAAMQDIDESDESEEAKVSRQNRELAEHGKAAAEEKRGVFKKASKGLSSPTDSPLSLVPWIFLLIIIGVILWSVRS